MIDERHGERDETTRVMLTRRRLLRLLGTSAAGLSAAALLAACGGGESAPTSGTSGGGGAAPTATTAPVQGTPGAGQASPTSGASAAKANYDKPVKISFSTWTGYGPIWLAQQQGFFKAHGLDVNIQVIESPGERLNALAAGALDGAASTVDTFVRVAAKGIPVVQVMGIDESVGGDGIVAKKEIQSIKDLKGKTVAVSIGSTSHWFLANVLDQNGMSLDDVKVQDMTAGDAGAAFVAGRVDVAVTWEPWLSRAQQTDFGHTLVTSKEYPGLIVDSFGFRPDFAKAHPDVVVAFLAGWNDAMNYWKANQDPAVKIMADALKVKPESFTADLAGLRIFTIDDSKQYFGTADSPGPIYQVADKAADFWMKIKVIDKKPDVKAIIDPSYLYKL